MKKKNGRYLEDERIAWYRDNKLHREDGPAVERINGVEWWINGELHREDGPACEFKDPDEGDYFYEWYLNGKEVTEEEIGHLIDKKSLNEKLHSRLMEKNKIKRPKI